MDWKRLGGISVGIIVLLSAVFTYLHFANQGGWFPYSSKAVSIESPDDDYLFTTGFVVRLSGSFTEADRIWIAAEDQQGTWRPLAEAAPSANDKLRATVRAGQVTSPVELCAIRTDTAAADVFRGATAPGKPASSLPALPPGAEQLDCTDVEPAR